MTAEMTLLDSADVARQAGISYGQLDRFARRGLIGAAYFKGGSGNRRWWDPGVIPVLRLLGRLTDAGFPPEMVAKIALSGEGRTEIAPGIWVEVESRG